MEDQPKAGFFKVDQGSLCLGLSKANLLQAGLALARIDHIILSVPVHCWTGFAETAGGSVIPTHVSLATHFLRVPIANRQCVFRIPKENYDWSPLQNWSPLVWPGPATWLQVYLRARIECRLPLESSKGLL